MSTDDKWLSAMLRRPQLGNATPDCLDAETLAAWTDGGLTSQQAAAAELHASACVRCTAVLAGVDRSAMTGASQHAPRRASVLRWLVPLTAAATAVAIWVAVPDRDPRPSELTVAQDAPVQPLEDAARTPPDAKPPPPPPTTPAAKSEVAQERSNMKRADRPADRQAESGVRERAATESRDMAAEAVPPMRAPVEAPAPAPPSAPNAQSAPAPGAAATEAAGAPAATLARRFEFSPEFSPTPIESVSPSNALHRWRVVPPASIERSLDGGMTWLPVKPLPGAVSTRSQQTVVTGLRAGDDRRVAATTSDRRTFYTTDAGASWTLVQENRPVPF